MLYLQVEETMCEPDSTLWMVLVTQAQLSEVMTQFCVKGWDVPLCSEFTISKFVL
jgi:hypothetical protein